MERYDPAHSLLAGLPELRPGDVGMHVLVAPTDTPGPRLHLRSDAAGDARSASPTRPCAGWWSSRMPATRGSPPSTRPSASCVARDVELPDKTAALSFCSRADFAESVDRCEHEVPVIEQAADLASHLTPADDGTRPPRPRREGHRRVHPRAAAQARRRDGDELAPRPRTARVRVHGTAAPAGALGGRPGRRSTRTVDGEPVAVDAQDFVVDCTTGSASPTTCCRSTSRRSPARSRQRGVEAHPPPALLRRPGPRRLPGDRGAR